VPLSNSEYRQQPVLEDRRLDYSQLTQAQYNAGLINHLDSARHHRDRIDEMRDDWPHYKAYLATHEPEELSRIQYLYDAPALDARSAGRDDIREMLDERYAPTHEHNERYLAAHPDRETAVRQADRFTVQKLDLVEGG
jgi:hypothetical protein